MSQRSACSILGSRWLGILGPAAFFAFGLQGPASAQEFAEALLVDLDARDASAGELVWENQAPDSIGDFLEFGNPIKEEIDGVDAVTFNVDPLVQDSYKSEVDTSAAPGLYGVDATASIEAWVYNPSLVDEETILAWAWRGGNPDGSNMSFNYGSNQFFGAVGHWGAPDLGWNNAGGAYIHNNNRVFFDGAGF